MAMTAEAIMAKRWSDYSVLMTTEEVAEVLRISYRTVLRLVEREEFSARKVGREWRYNRGEIMEYVGVDPDEALEAQAGDE